MDLTVRASHGCMLRARKCCARGRCGVGEVVLDLLGSAYLRPLRAKDDRRGGVGRVCLIGERPFA